MQKFLCYLTKPKKTLLISVKEGQGWELTGYYWNVICLGTYLKENTFILFFLTTLLFYFS